MPPGKSKRPTVQIGVLAKRAGVSVRAIRYYEEIGLINPSGHSQGGFRLYGEENLKRLQVINYLKELGLKLNEIQEIFLAKKNAGGGKKTVNYLLKVFSEKLSLVEAKIETLAEIKRELANAIRILHACGRCNHAVLLDAVSCEDCANLMPRETVPDAFEVILQ